MKLHGIAEHVVQGAMEDRQLTQSAAIHFLLQRYIEIQQDLERRGVTIREHPARIELEFPK